MDDTIILKAVNQKLAEILDAAAEKLSFLAHHTYAPDEIPHEERQRQFAEIQKLIRRAHRAIEHAKAKDANGNFQYINKEPPFPERSSAWDNFKYVTSDLKHEFLAVLACFAVIGGAIAFLLLTK